MKFPWKTKSGKRLSWRRIWRDESKTLVTVTIGTLLSCFAMVALIMPYRFAGGGVVGLALLSEYVWGISPAWVVTIANIILLIWGWKALSPRFALWTSYVTLLTSFAIPIMAQFRYPLLSNTILAAILAGMVAGVGYGMLFKAEASSGGTDIIAMVIRKRRGVDVGAMNFYLNSSVLALSILELDIENILMGVLLLYVEALMIDRVLKSFNRRTQMTIISNQTEAISEYITGNLHRSATMIPAKGVYSGRDVQVLIVVVNRRQSVMLKNFVHNVDPRAFLIFSDASEVVGRGFKGWDATA